ncbi:MAG: hypothetical protein AAFZ74_01530 [Pseudomonadota bacterium]
MSNTTFETFLVSGILVLIAAVGFLAWSAWRWVDRERDMEKRALTGISHEMRHNLKRMMKELAGVADGTLRSDIEIVPVIHPQLDALLSRPNEADRRGLTIIRGNYNELSAHKNSLRAALAHQSDVSAPANVAADAVVGAISTLYLWEEHKGRPPETAQSTRSWDVRDWMKANAFHADLLPGIHLRDQVVERLRTDGMALTPRPLTYTASEYFAMQYDRKADRNAPFWKRKKKPVEDDAAVEAEEVEVEVVEAEAVEAEMVEAEVVEAEVVEAEVVEVETQDAALEESIAAEPVTEPTQPSVQDAASAPEPAPEAQPASKPPTPGIVH